MPAFGAELDARQIWGLVLLLEGLAQTMAYFALIHAPADPHYEFKAFYDEAKRRGFRVNTNTTFLTTDTPKTVRDVLAENIGHDRLPELQEAGV